MIGLIGRDQFHGPVKRGHGSRDVAGLKAHQGEFVVRRSTCAARLLTWVTVCSTFWSILPRWVCRFRAALLKATARVCAAVSTPCRKVKFEGSGESCCRLLKKLLISAPMPEVALAN